MDLSVLEKQRAVVQRIYELQARSDSRKNQENDHLDMGVLSHARIHKAEDYHHCSYSFVSNTNNSSITRKPIPKPDSQCNQQGSPNKRKAEFDDRYSTRYAEEEKSEITSKTTSSNTCSKVSEPDYIHVRARRGQATDSHSLAERARREKISKKMKCLQDLVPGCSKVTGKAGMLDEIINYVHSLQKQVEFLSMKLAAINPRLDFSIIDNVFAKECGLKIPAYTASLAAAQFEATTDLHYYNPMQQGTSIDIAMDQSQILHQKRAGISSLPIPQMFLDSSCISLSGWESDWQSLFTAGLH